MRAEKENYATSNVQPLLPSPRRGVLVCDPPGSQMPPSTRASGPRSRRGSSARWWLMHLRRRPRLLRHGLRRLQARSASAPRQRSRASERLSPQSSSCRRPRRGQLQRPEQLWRPGQLRRWRQLIKRCVQSRTRSRPTLFWSARARQCASRHSAIVRWRCFARRSGCHRPLRYGRSSASGLRSARCTSTATTRAHSSGWAQWPRRTS
mmetsp:Transcript_10109/g.26710  ORF Transcript_10109/g.26710 Transcript_10109/m.26710 type:complete len:207 (+) Transcript_10109:119-739(+)